MLFFSPIKKGSLLFFSVIAVFTLQAQVKLPGCFSGNMILQRDKPIPVWGKAAPGEKVTVVFAGKTKSTTADAEGKWMVSLDKNSASAQPKELTVSSSNTITFKNVLVGDVWLCAQEKPES